MFNTFVSFFCIKKSKQKVVEYNLLPKFPELPSLHLPNEGDIKSYFIVTNSFVRQEALAVSTYFDGDRDKFMKQQVTKTSLVRIFKRGCNPTTYHFFPSFRIVEDHFLRPGTRSCSNSPKGQYVLRLTCSAEEAIARAKAGEFHKVIYDAVNYEDLCAWYRHAKCQVEKSKLPQIEIVDNLPHLLGLPDAEKKVYIVVSNSFNLPLDVSKYFNGSENDSVRDLAEDGTLYSYSRGGNQKPWAIVTFKRLRDIYLRCVMRGNNHFKGTYVLISHYPAEKVVELAKEGRFHKAIDGAVNYLDLCDRYKNHKYPIKFIENPHSKEHKCLSLGMGCCLL